MKVEANTSTNKHQQQSFGMEGVQRMLEMMAQQMRAQQEEMCRELITQLTLTGRNKSTADQVAIIIPAPTARFTCAKSVKRIRLSHSFSCASDTIVGESNS